MAPVSPSLPALNVLILAAGASSRMRGADKLLEPVAGQPLLRHIAVQALRAGLPVTVALPPDRPLRDAALVGLAVGRVIVTDAALGMAASLRAGLAAISDTAAVMLLLADLPEITEADLRLMADAQRALPDRILRATASDGTPGHPVIFPPDTRAALARLTGDEGARRVLHDQSDRVTLFALPDAHATTDLDTPEAWAAWRADHGSRA